MSRATWHEFGRVSVQWFGIVLAVQGMLAFSGMTPMTVKEGVIMAVGGVVLTWFVLLFKPNHYRRGRAASAPAPGRISPNSE